MTKVVASIGFGCAQTLGATPMLDVTREQRCMRETLRDLEARKLVELHWLQGQTWRDLNHAMRSGPWHISHFIGHGGFDRQTDQGYWYSQMKKASLMCWASRDYRSDHIF